MSSAPSVRPMHASRVLALSCAFWAVGSAVCLSFAVVDLVVRLNGFPPDVRDRYPHLNAAVAAGGAALGLLQGIFVFARLALRDAKRIVAMDAPAWHDFFPKTGLVAVFCVACTCAVTERILLKYFYAVL